MDPNQERSNLTSLPSQVSEIGVPAFLLCFYFKLVVVVKGWALMWKSQFFSFKTATCNVAKHVQQPAFRVYRHNEQVHEQGSVCG
jgi:hypothetical protein